MKTLIALLLLVTAACSTPVRFESVPAGAEVFVGNEATPRGRTPCVVELSDFSSSTTVYVRLEGWKGWTGTIEQRPTGEVYAVTGAYSGQGYMVLTSHLAPVLAWPELVRVTLEPWER